MAKAMTKTFTPLVVPFNMFPSIKSEKELIMGTPGIKNNTEVDKACINSTSGFKKEKRPTKKEEVKAAKKIHK